LLTHRRVLVWLQQFAGVKKFRKPYYYPRVCCPQVKDPFLFGTSIDRRHSHAWTEGSELKEDNHNPEKRERSQEAKKLGPSATSEWRDQGVLGEPGKGLTCNGQNKRRDRKHLKWKKKHHVRAARLREIVRKNSRGVLPAFPGTCKGRDGSFREHPKKS